MDHVHEDPYQFGCTILLNQKSGLYWNDLVNGNSGERFTFTRDAMLEYVHYLIHIGNKHIFRIK